MSHLDDAALVAQVQKGNLDAFEGLYDRYKTMIYRTALGITHDHAAAEEITQECFVRAYRNMHRVDTNTCLGPWLHRIAANLSYNWWRVARRQRIVPLEVVEQMSQPASDNAPMRAAQTNEMQRVITEAVQSLRFEHRVTIILFYLNGFSLEEIAYVLNCPVGTVKSRLHYGRRVLRKKLERVWRTRAEVAYEFL